MLLRHLSISLLEATLVHEGRCLSCNEKISPEELFAISVFLSTEATLVFHDDECFDRFVQALNDFDSRREAFRNGPSDLIN